MWGAIFTKYSNSFETSTIKMNTMLVNKQKEDQWEKKNNIPTKFYINVIYNEVNLFNLQEKHLLNSFIGITGLL